MNKGYILFSFSCFSFFESFISVVLLVVLQFESSGKWPNDIEAVQNIKAAFYVQLGSLLKTKCSLLAQSSNSFVDVLKVRNS